MIALVVATFLRFAAVTCFICAAEASAAHYGGAAFLIVFFGAFLWQLSEGFTELAK